MADKDFKVKTGLDLPAPLPVTEGGTGQTSVENTRNAIMPTQSGHSGKFITTDGTNMTWAVAPQQTATDGAVGYKVFAGNTTPTGQNVGDIWIDATTGNGIQLVRWRKTIAAGTSTISGLDDNNLTLTYTAGNEQVYINGVLITRGQDYTATNGTSISLTQAVEVGDTVEIFGNPLFSVTNTYTQAQADSRYINYNGLNAGGKNVLVNGLFDVWQRGTDVTTSTASPLLYSSADRWQNWVGASCNTRYQRIADADPGFSQYSYRIQRVAGVSTETNYQLTQNIETPIAKLLVGKTVTLSFRVRKGANWSDPDGFLRARVVYNNNVDGNAISQAGSDAFAANFNITNSFATYTMTGTIPASGVSTVMVNFFWEVRGTAGADDWLEFSAVQLEVGSNNTPFSRAGGDIGGELAKCQRYYYRVTSSLDSYVTFGLGWVDTSTQAYYTIPMPVTLRGNPNIAFSAANTFLAGIPGGSLTGTATATNTLGSQLPVVRLTVASGLTPGNATRLLANGTSNAYIEFSAEL